MSAKIQPVAWAVYADSFGDDGPAVCKHREVSERLAREVGGRLVPLLATDCAAQAPDFAPQAPDFAPQAPDNGNATLTDAEREAIHFMFRHAAQAADHDPFPDSADYIPHHKVISAMMERLK